MVALGLFGGIGIAVVAVLTLALKALSEAKGRREEAVGRATAESDLRSERTKATAEKARADFQEKRANALDAAIVRHSAARPVAGSYELLEARERANAGTADGGGPDGLHNAGDGEGATEAVDPERLFAPGE